MTKTKVCRTIIKRR